MAVYTKLNHTKGTSSLGNRRLWCLDILLPKQDPVARKVGSQSMPHLEFSAESEEHGH